MGELDHECIWPDQHVLEYDKEHATVCYCGRVGVIPVNRLLQDGIPDLGLTKMWLTVRRLDDRGNPLG